MSFTNFLCWEPNRVRTVMNTNAELASEEIFLAVHTAYPLRAQIGNAAESLIDPENLITRFLNPNARHIQIVIQGESGTGKSHFIKWMEYNIPDDEKYEVISIPRSSLSLRGILELIIAVLPDNLAQEYQGYLDQSGSIHSSEEQLKSELRRRIASSIGRDKADESSELFDVEEDLIDHLPNLFDDPTVARHIERTGGAIQELVQHIMNDSKEYTPVEGRRIFEETDLFLDDIQVTNTAQATQYVLNQLRMDSETRDLALTIINRNVDNAIAEILNFTGDRLPNLFNTVRRHLKALDKELILLIEDMARTQGLDRPILEALIEENEDLCNFRWAAAATTGYYQSLPNTVQTRTDVLVQMDKSATEEDSTLTQSFLSKFSAKYLNAVRLDPNDLSNWIQSDSDRQKIGPPPNACNQCDFREECHASFGSDGDIGLYPFTENALLNMYRRHTENYQQAATIFTPRILVKDVMAELLDVRSNEIANGDFPSFEFLSDMGGGFLPPEVSQSLLRENTSFGGRQLAMMELWGGNPSRRGTLLDLPNGMFSAFGLEKPELDESPAAEPTTIEPDSPTTSVDSRVQAIRNWGNGSAMDDSIVNILRPMIYALISSNIDWDQEGLVRTHFMRADGRIFNRGSGITFSKQAGRQNPNYSGVKLNIPIEEDDLLESAVALEGLYEFSRNSSWPSENSFLSLSNQLEKWTKYLLPRFHNMPVSNEDWNVTGAAIELLAVGAAMAGGVRRNGGWTAYHNEIFSAWPTDVIGESDEWKSIYRSINNKKDDLLDIAKARASGTKGGTGTAFLNPLEIVPILISLRKTQWRPNHVPPNEEYSVRIYTELANLHKQVFDAIENAARKELRSKTQWYREWTAAFGDEVTKKQLIDLITTVTESVTSQGLRVSPGVRNQLNRDRDSIESVNLDNALKITKNLVTSEDEPLTQLPELGRIIHANAMSAAQVLSATLERYVDEVENAFLNEESSSGIGGVEIYEQNQSTIRSSLNSLISDLKELDEVET